MLKKLNIVGLALVAMLIMVGVAFSASGDQGRRLSGPFCIGKPNAGVNAGVVRSIAATQKCRSYEIRKFGVAVPHPERAAGAAPAPGPAGATGPAGAKGDTGAVGAKGATGEQGAPGKDGKDGTNGVDGAVGPKGDTGATGETGAQGIQGEKGDTGAQGAPGAKGDTGATGATGATGPKGDKGDAGLGDGYRWICKIGQGQGSLKDGGTAATPDCVRGSDFAFKVVTVGAIVSFDHDDD
jgi:Collagen triple helix repeat (20 copies)